MRLEIKFNKGAANWNYYVLVWYTRIETWVFDTTNTVIYLLNPSANASLQSYKNKQRTTADRSNTV